MKATRTPQKVFMRRQAPPAEFSRTVSYMVDTSSHQELPDQELIRRRAYEIFEARGGQSGHEVEDWHQAEQEVKKQMNTQ
jgi:hypothetical protein